MVDTVPASEFTRNFGRYRMLAQREAVAVSSHGSITGYFVAPDEYEEFRRFKERRRSFATADLSDERAQAISSSRMDERHAHRCLNRNSASACRYPHPNRVSSYPMPICGTTSTNQDGTKGAKIVRA